MTSCMGGWCNSRGWCKFHREITEASEERLCPPGKEYPVAFMRDKA